MFGRAGAQYARRVGLQPPAADHDPIFAGFKPGAFSLFFGDSPFYHFDLEGRWQRAVIEGTHFLKGLDGRVQVIRRLRDERNLVLKRHIQSEGDASDFDRRIRSAVIELVAGIDAGRLERIEPPVSKAAPLAQGELHEFLERIVRWDQGAWAADQARYLAAYGSEPLGFLPPECQNAVVLQATLGESGGAAFGGSAAGGRHVRSQPEFQEHATLVAALWGRRVTQSRFVFVSGSDLLRQPVENVAGYLDVIRRTFPIAPLRRSESRVRPKPDETGSGLAAAHALLDDFRPPKPDSAGWSELAKGGLGRVSLGVESGDPETRALFRKDYTEEDLMATVRDLKSAGIGISLLTLVGAGGLERARATRATHSTAVRVTWRRSRRFRLLAR